LLFHDLKSQGKVREFDYTLSQKKNVTPFIFVTSLSDFIQFC